MATMMADQFNQDEPQRVYNWYLRIPILGESEFTLHVEQVRMPTFGTAVLKERFFNQDIKVAGAAVVGDNQIVVRDTCSKSAYNKIVEWSKKVHDPASGKIGMATEYKEQGTLELTTPGGITTKNIIVKGVWPSQIAGTELSYGPEAGDVKIQMTLQVDKYIFA